jgi:DNA modification methylase
MNKLITELTPHPKNKEIYGDKDIPKSFLESIAKKGVMCPLVIKEDGTIISGHRRYKAAKENDLKKVPVGIASFETETDEIEAIIDYNRQREKTFSQKMREAEELEIIERQKAKQRMSEGGKGVEKLPHPNSGKSRDKITEQTGFGSGRTYDTAKKIWDKAKDGDQHSKKLVKELNAGKKSIHGAAKETKKKEKKEKLESKKEEIKQQEKSSIGETPTVTKKHYSEFLHSIEDKSVNLLLTDPPFSTNIDDISSFANDWLPKALKKVSTDGRGFICIGAYPKEIQAYLSVFAQQRRFILDSPLIWTYRNTLGRTPNRKYNLNYQMILHFYSEKSEDLDTSITNEMFSVQDINAPDGRQGDRFHKWQKPSKLASRLIRHSTKEGDYIIDLFCGSGTFLVEAGKLNRHSSGCDIDGKALKIAVERGCNELQ